MYLGKEDCTDPLKRPHRTTGLQDTLQQLLLYRILSSIYPSYRCKETKGTDICSLENMKNLFYT